MCLGGQDLRGQRRGIRVAGVGQRLGEVIPFVAGISPVLLWSIDIAGWNVLG
ncbi:MAG TPA: hypothetical protein VI365_00505 [Trebonia sp.]